MVVSNPAYSIVFQKNDNLFCFQTQGTFQKKERDYPWQELGDRLI